MSIVAIIVFLVFALSVSIELAKRNDTVKSCLENIISFDDDKKWYSVVVKYSWQIAILIILGVVGYFFKAVLEAVILALIAFFGGKYLWGKYKDNLPEPIRVFLNEISEFFKKDDVNHNKKFIITAIAGVGGKIDPAGESSVYGGDNLLFIFIPDTNHLISTVSVDGVEVVYDDAGLSFTFKNVKQNHIIRVTFSAIAT